MFRIIYPKLGSQNDFYFITQTPNQSNLLPSLILSKPMRIADGAAAERVFFSQLFSRKIQRTLLRGKL
jgi:hypothetical protein